ncbi:TetR/AcrR family transcriptional regulator [Micromonospora carbonacea]|uniref:TetR/AcrR family transcriptional regulator n=1 Tax=Micromonospora carbonacea TaxID=47853 RepID=A0A7H8XKM5_9ACTN|nr:TetR/AcrR family transcriptional regulator [Micromonospora carbonacea]MBB5825911.1 AcrR family transcriptional regulator [Micromonospora carbonacea]QLD25506.1 TetR/AcrR family transcriptional regulator [Micromonospora carbonacea]
MSAGRPAVARQVPHHGTEAHRRHPRTKPEQRLPGRPRSEQASRAIIAATLEMLAEGVSLDSLSMEAVATRAGVGKATLYRRWSNKAALISDALVSLYEPPVPVLRGSVREELTTAVDDLRRWTRDSIAGRLLTHFTSGPCCSPELRAQYFQSVIEPKKAVFREILRRRIVNGDVHPSIDIEATLWIVFGSVLFGYALSEGAGEEQFSSDNIVDLILPGISSASPPQ